MASTNTILSLNEKHASTVRELLDLFPMIPGAFKEVFRKCGKPNCWCAQHNRGHSLRRITWTEDGRSQSKAVASEDIDWYIIATENYRRFQYLLKTLRDIEQNMHDVLADYLISQVTKSRIERDGRDTITKT